MNLNPLNKMLEYISHSSAGREVIGAVRDAQNWVGRNVAREAIEQAGQLAVGAEILSAWALLHSESLGGWQNPDFINGYMRNPEDGKWYSSPPEPDYGVWEWSGIADAETTENLNILRTSNISLNEIEHLTPDVEDVQIDGYISIITKVIPAILKFVDSSTPSLFTQAQSARPIRRDPLTFDLDGDGLETVGINPANPILFDHDGDGLKTATGWVKADDAFLVLDRNGNGTIDTGAELFGDSTPVFDALGVQTGAAADGFAALAQQDTNADGQVNSADARWADLRLWQDFNQDGISDAGELFTLDALGIASINVAKTEHTKTLPNGNQIADVGSYTRVDGSSGEIDAVSGDLGDINLAEDTFYSEFTDTIPVTPQAQALPDMQGSGLVRDLHQAASQNTVLASLLGQYATATREQQLALLPALLDAWADTSGMVETLADRDNQYLIQYDSFGSVRRSDHLVEPEGGWATVGGGSGGSGYGGVTLGVHDVVNPVLDQTYRDTIAYWDQLIHTLEAFNGRYFFKLPNEGQDGGAVSGKTFVAASGSGGGGTGGVTQGGTLIINYLSQQLTLMQRSYDALKSSVYEALVLQTRLKPLLDAVQLNITDDGVTLNFTAVETEFHARIAADAENGLADLIDFNRAAGTMLQGTSWNGWGLFANELATQTLTPALTTFLTGLGIHIKGQSGYSATGTSGDEVIVGNGSADTLSGRDGRDVLIGAGGNDVLYGGNQDDSLLGGTGADRLYGEAGNDVLDGGAGNDTLSGGSGADIYHFGLGDGKDVIVDSGSNTGLEDELWMGDGLTQSDFSFIRNGDNLTLRHVNGIDQITITNWFLEGALPRQLGKIGFADGTTWTADALSELLVAVTGTADADTLVGADGHYNFMFGVEGNDSLTGGNLNDRLDGGSGDDAMSGAAGNDTYIVDSTGDVVTESTNSGIDLVESSVNYVLTANVENLMLTGGDYQYGTGNELNNVIIGNDHQNTLNGAAGADTMIGGDDNDNYTVDDSGDIVVENANEGIDTVRTSLSYTLGANQENLSLNATSSNTDGTGNELNNSIWGNSGVNTLVGNAGNDFLDGYGSLDTLIGGTGNDTYHFDGGVDTVIEAAGEGNDSVNSNVTYTLVANVENLNLFGTTAISGTGNELDNVLYGNSNSAANTLSGKQGNDIYYVSTGDIVVEALDEGGADIVYSDVTRTLGANIENLTLTGSNAINGTGNGLNNILVGNIATNTLAGGLGDDKYYVESGDVVSEAANAGFDEVFSYVDFVLGNNVENLALLGSAISGTGNSLNNWIAGNQLDNTLSGAAGADTMSGLAGDDTYVVDNADDVVLESYANGGGVDTVLSSISYTLASSVENMTLTGTAAINATGNELDNVLTGNNAANSLTGSVGNDTLNGGGGGDTMTGGTGNDVYVVNVSSDSVVEAAGEGTDTVQSGLTYTLGANVENLTLTGTTAINGTGNSLDNVLVGNTANNTLAGGVGNDTYIVQNTGDTVSEASNAGTDTVQSSVTYTLATNVENLTLTGATAINGTGNALDNLLVGNDLANTLSGLAGNDTMAGGLGDDIYVVDSTGDVILENVGGGTDAAQSSVTYTLSANVENLTLTGSTAINGTGNGLDNVLSGNTAANTLTGGQGNDTYMADAADTIVENTGEGIDTVQAGVSYTLAANVENLLLTGTAAISGIGNVLDNVLTGNGAVNTLTGGAGNDILDGAAGADTMIGGLGDDLYYVSVGTDVVTEAAGEGTDTVQSSATYTLAANVENLTLAGTTAINGTGNALDNILTGNSANNTLSGGAGNDTYFVQNTGDVVSEAAIAGTDSVHSSVTYTLATNVENLVLEDAGWIDGTGNALDNTLTGNSSNNVLDGKAGADTMAGGLEDDTYVVDNVGDVVIENLEEGGDTVQSSVTYTLASNVEYLTLTGTATIGGTGNELDNVVIGNSGANTLVGGAGNDILDGGTGIDSLIGGLGDDTYVINVATDVVTEAAGEGTDTIQSTVTVTLGQGNNVENLTLIGTGTISGTGNELDNLLIGNSATNTLTGKTGNDTYVVQNTTDVVVEVAGEGTDLIQSSVNYTLSANVENLTLTGETATTGTGNGLDNLLTGNGLANTLDGKAGSDAMAGGAGDDVYVVDNIADSVLENSNDGLDTVQSSVTYVLAENVENLTLTGTTAIDGTGNELNNTLTGNNVANELNGGSGFDVMKGGAGNDVYVVDSEMDVVVEAGAQGTDTVVSSVNYALAANVENLTLTGAATDALGNTLNNTLTGNAENNRLDGGSGVDTMIGGLGDDTYVISVATDVAVENAGEGADTVQSGVAYTLGANLENLVLTGSSAVSGTGNELNNVLIGNVAVNTLNGGTGDDSMSGGLGNDIYVVDSSGDLVIEFLSEGTDLVQASVTYTLGENIEKLTLTGTAAINGIGNTLNNTLTGNTSDNVLDGGIGTDTLVGGAGNDTYLIDSDDIVTEAANAGIDTIVSSFAFTASANVENLTLLGTEQIDGTGNTLSNVLTGNSGINGLFGLAGNDTLDGMAGNDWLSGGTGNDVYKLDRGYGVDTVVESDATAGNTDLALFASGIATDQLWFQHVGNNLEVSIIGTSDKLVIQNWYTGTANHVEQFKTADNKLLLDTQVENLVQAMAGFTPPAAGETTLPPAYQTTLAPVLAANWQ